MRAFSDGGAVSGGAFASGESLPERRILGLHSPEIKAVAKQLSREGGEVVMSDRTHQPFDGRRECSYEQVSSCQGKRIT